MTDIARLGLAIDSSQATKATAALNQFAAAGAKADAAAAKLTGSTNTQSAAGSKLAKQLAELDRLQKSVEANQAKLAASGAKVSKAIDGLQKSGGLARHELINLSRQVQDVGVSLASGQSPFTVLIQQGAQIGDIFGTTNGTLRGFGAQVMSVITPMRLLGGVVGLTAAAVVGLGISWKNFALQLDDVAKRTGVTSSEFAKLQAVASFKGIGNSDFNEAMARFSENVATARTGVGELAGLLRVNGVQAKSVADAFDKVASLVKNARTEQQKYNILQEAGLPANAEWVRLMSQGADGIARAKGEAAAFGGEINDKMVANARRFDELVNKAWTNGLLTVKDLFVKIVDAITRFNTALEGNGINKLIRAVMPLAYLARALGAEDPDANGMPPESGRAPTRLTVHPGPRAQTSQPPPKTLAQQMAELNRFTSMVGTLGDLATVDEKVSAAEAQLQIAFLQTGMSLGGRKQAFLDMIRAQAEMDRVQQQATIGVFNADAAAKAFQDTLQTYITKGLLDPKNADQMAAANTALAKSYKQIKEAAAIAAAPLEQLKRLQLDAADLTKGIDQVATNGLNSFTDALVDMASGAKSAQQAFSDMVTSILKDILRLIIRSQITGPLAGALQGMLGSFLPGTGGGGYGFNGGRIGGMYADGGFISGPGTGRSDSILARVSNGEFVVNAAATAQHRSMLEAINRGVRMPGFASGGAVANNNVAGGGIKVISNVHNYAGTPGVKQNVKRGADGSLTIDTIIPQLENALAARGAAGRGAMAKTFQRKTVGFG